MKVALFSNTYPPSLNGVANVTHFYRLGLAARGHEVHVFAPASVGEDPFANDPSVHRYASLRVPGEVDYMMALPRVFCRSITREVKREKFDVVHAQHPIWVGRWGQKIARESGIPVVSTAHSQYDLYANCAFLPTEWIERLVMRYIVRYFNRCQVVTTPAQWMQTLLIDRGVSALVELVPNPVDLSSLREPEREATRARFGFTDQDIIVGYLGRLSTVKRMELLIDSVALVARRRPEVRLVVVGDGADRKELCKHAKKHLGERALFTGSVPHGEVGHYHAMFDVFAATSKSETQPLAYTESMYVGTPVVAFATPGAADMITDGENGLLVPPSAGIKGLAEALERVISDPDLADRLRAGGRRYAEARHYTAVAECLEEVYAKARDRSASGW